MYIPNPVEMNIIYTLLYAILLLGKVITLYIEWLLAFKIV